MNYQQLLQEAEKYVSEFYAQHTDARIVYHNKAHTQYVVSAAIEIANHYQLNDEDFFIVVTAAWFHDLGYYLTEPKGHEEKSAEQAAVFLALHKVNEATKARIRSCILATRMPQQPITLLEKILCDADLFHLGTDSFPEMNKLMRKEVEALQHTQLEKTEWRKNAIRFLERQQYHTDYCQLLLEPAKAAHLKKLKQKLSEEDTTAAPALPLAPTPAAAEPAKEEKKTFKMDRPDKGIETMFRISSGNHQRLSDMADNKAHIMITVNSIILSVILSGLLRKLDEYPHLTIPALLLLAVCVATMVISILATRPKIPEGTFTREDIQQKKVNLLFFGNFYRMPLDEYAWGMQEVMKDREFLYGSLIRDVYAQGVVLGKKYKLLRLSYSIFMYGLIISVLVFAIATVIYTEASPK